jgi:hypothetical protein
MAKSLNDVLKLHSDALAGKRNSTTTTLTTGENPGVDYADKMKDSRDFIAQHSVEKFDDRVGNGDDVYQATNVKKAAMERHGHEPKPKDIKVYNKNQQVGQVENKLKEAKDESEYGNEGEMAVTQLKTISRHAEHLIKMMKPDTDLPEWVQSKITKAEDYISTAHDYLMSEMNEEAEQLDELGDKMISKLKIRGIQADNAAMSAMDDVEGKRMDASTAANIKKHSDISRKAFGLAQKISDKQKKKMLAKEEVELSEAKCNMTEAGKMCEVHGNKACPKEGAETAADKETRYTGKTKEGRQLITDKKLQEMAASQNQAIAASIALKHKREGTMPPKGTASHSMMDMSEKQLKDYTKAEPGAPKKVEESISDQRSSRKTSSEEARKEIYKALLRKKERQEKMKEASDNINTYPADAGNNLGWRL